MAGRGERIGDAYVKIHADGTTFGDSLRDDLNSARLGEDEGEKFRKGFEKGFNEDFDDKKFLNSMNKALGKMSGRLERLDLVEDDLREKIERAFAGTFDGDLGRRMAQNLIDDLQEGLRSFDGDSLFGDLDRQVRVATMQISREWDEMLDQAYKANEEFNRKLAADRDREFEDEMERLAALARAREVERQVGVNMARQVAKFRELQAKAERKLAAEERAATKERKDRFDDLLESVKRLAKGTQEAGERLSVTRDRLRTLRVSMRDAGEATRDVETSFRRMEHTLRQATPRFDRFNNRFNAFANTVGRAFGAGARNNFLNIMGKMVAGGIKLFSVFTVGIVQMGLKVAKVTAEIADNFRQMATAVAQAFSQEGFKAAIATFGNSIIFAETTFATAGLNIIAGLVALGLAMGAVVVSAGAFAAILSGLAAAITALAGSISFALAGAIFPLVGALAPLTAGILTVVAAWKSLDDAQKDALKADLKPLADSFGELADAAGEVLFRDVGKWARELKPAIDNLKPTIEGVAAAIRDSIGEAITEAATSPGFRKFQQEFEEFLPGAVKSLSDSIFNLAGGLGGVFRALIPITSEFLTWLSKITQEFSEWANSAEGQTRLKNFFESAAESAKDVGEFLKQAGKALGELFSAGRQSGGNIFRSMASAMEDFVTWANNPQGKKSLREWFEFGEKLAGAIGDALSAIIGLIDALDTPTTRSFAVGLIDTFTTLTHIVSGLIRTIGDFLDPLVSLIGFLPGKLLGAFGGDKVKKAAEDFTKASERSTESAQAWTDSVLDLQGSLDGLTGKITGQTRIAALDQLEQTIPGITAAMDRLGVSQRVLAQAAVGNGEAIQKVTQAYAAGATQADLAAISEEGLSRALGQTKLATDEAVAAERNRILVGQDLTGMLKGIPKDVRSDIRLEGVVPTLNGVAEVANKYDLLDKKQVTTLLKVAGIEPSEANIQKIMDKIKALEAVKPDLKGLKDGVASASSATAAEASITGGKFIQNLNAALGKKVNFDPLKNSINTETKDMKAKGANQGSSVGSSIGQGVVAGLSAWSGPLAVVAARIVDNAIASMRNAADSHSPSRKTAALGEDIAQGLADGMTASERLVTTAASQMVSGALDVLSQPFETKIATASGITSAGSATTSSLSPVGSPTTNGGRNITIPSITVVTPAEDPAAVAREVMNIAVGSGY